MVLSVFPSVDVYILFCHYHLFLQCVCVCVCVCGHHPMCCVGLDGVISRYFRCRSPASGSEIMFLLFLLSLVVLGNHG